ncbi:MAG: hypothetical protein ACRD96_16605, partial [Bryobacteraceae bacterium]
GVIAAAAAFLMSTRDVALSQPAPGDAVVSFRVRLGVGDSEPSAWDGTVKAINGEVLALRNWHPRPGDRIDGASGWSLATRKGINFARRPWEEDVPLGETPYLNIPGLIVDLKTTASTSVQFETRHGSFVVTPRLVETGKPLRVLGGRVVIDRVPTAQSLSTRDYHDDFATMLSGKDGEVWVAWVAYRDKGQEVFARRFDGAAWTPLRKITEKPGDVFLVKMGRDKQGRPWIVWSQQSDGNWDLYGRPLDGPVERLTDDAQPDLYHNLATDSAGNLWLAWQGFRGGKSDIFARRYDGKSWSAAEKISTSPANDWEPAIAADGAGRVHIAWDTYDRGNYDVAMRSWAGGKWTAIAPVAATPRFEAHASLACDPKGRVWAVWSETGFQWGKDSGFLIKKEATRLYQSRWIGLAVNDGGAWKEPAAPLERSLPEDFREYNDFPVVQIDGAGRPWVFFRHRWAKFRDVHNNTPAHRAAWEIFGTALDGDRWTAPMELPFSPSRQDVRGGFASDGKGNLWAAWITDQRDFEEFLFQHADIYAARLPGIAGAPPEIALQPRVVREVKTFQGAHENEAADLARIRAYTLDSEGRRYRIYRGDTHRHTEYSMDGNNDGTLHQTYRYALDAADLDFLGVSEHNGLGGPDLDYVNHLLQQAADLFYTAGRFTPLYAYERSVGYPNGHRNILFATRGNPALPIPQAE